MKCLLRLPSEAEWEYAARGEKGRKYPWGNVPEPSCDYAIMNPPRDAGNGCGTHRMWEVCSKTNGNTPLDLCDMAGNVWEWVEDDFHENYNNAPIDGRAWKDSPRASSRVLRGGCWVYDANVLRSAFRIWSHPGYRSDNVGFRVVRASPAIDY